MSTSSEKSKLGVGHSSVRFSLRTAHSTSFVFFLLAVARRTIFVDLQSVLFVYRLPNLGGSCPILGAL